MHCKTSRWAIMLVNDIGKYIVILQDKFLCANHGHFRYKESNFQGIECWKEYHMCILSIGAHLMEQFLLCLELWGPNRLKKVKFLHPETSCYYKVIQNTYLFDNNFPAKIFSISQQHSLLHKVYTSAR